jgi:Holliday junction resolvase RusA-like endonuclease
LTSPGEKRRFTQTLFPAAYSSPGGLTQGNLRMKDGRIGWRTRVDPADILLDITIPGHPQVKQRPRHTRATLTKDGAVIQPHEYTPPKTRQAEETLRWIYRAARVGEHAVQHPVGILVFFRTSGSRPGDTDNFLKLVLDAGNGVIWADDSQVTEHHVHHLRNCTVPGTDLLVWRTGRRAPGGPT